MPHRHWAKGNYAYLGLYWTWGKKKANGDKPGDQAGAAFHDAGLPGPLGRILEVEFPPKETCEFPIWANIDSHSATRLLLP